MLSSGRFPAGTSHRDAVLCGKKLTPRLTRVTIESIKCVSRFEIDFQNFAFAGSETG